MRIGVPKETKNGEGRCGATPDLVLGLVERGHEVVVEVGAGSVAGFDDAAFERAGARLVSRSEEAFASALILKVKELQPQEYDRLPTGSIVAGYQQLARDPRLLDAVLTQRITALAYEGVIAPGGVRPLLAPMSAIAGTMTAQIAAWALQRDSGPLPRRGILLSGIEGVPPARVLIVGDGTVGWASARAFLRAGCEVTMLGASMVRMKALQDELDEEALHIGLSTPEELTHRLPETDVLIGAVAVPGRLSPKLITRAMLQRMQLGSVFIDVGIDMGGIAETSRSTKLSEPLYLEEGVLHYCVPNIPALVPRAATQALAAATTPYLLAIAELGLEGALRELPGLQDGLLVHDGQVVNQGLAEDTARPFHPFSLHTR